MKKLLLLIACCLQFSNAQNTIVGEYISTTKNSNGVKLFFLEDGTYQISVFTGKYKIDNDSIILENGNKQNSFNLLYENSEKASNKLTIKLSNNYYSLFNTEYLGIQKTENAKIEYKLFSEYFDVQELEEYSDSINRAVESVPETAESNSENIEPKLSFEIDKSYALYFVKYSETKSNIEKYIIPNDVNIVDVSIQDNYLADLELSGKIEKDKSVIFLTDGRSPLSFTKKSEIKIPAYVSPVKKSSEKNWTFEGMKSREDVYAYDSTAVAVDTAYVVNGNEYQFKAKVEKNLKEALLNIKKDTAKYVLVYYNLKDKKAEKNFNTFVSNYNENVSYSMYEGYNSVYDNFNFYLATKSDDSFFSKKNIKEKSVVIVNKDGEIIASSSEILDEVARTLNYDNSSLINNLKETENSIALANSVSNKKINIPDLTKILNSNYKNFYLDKDYYANTTIDTAVSVVDYPSNIENENEEIVAEDAVADAGKAVAADYENNDFIYYKSEVSEKVVAEKLNTIFEFYNSKNIVNNDLVNILLGEISGNHISFDLFKNENNTNNKQEIKYINYILKYNEEDGIKNKIAKIINDIITYKTENSETATYNAISYNLIAYSGNDLNILKSVINLYNQKEQGSEEANKLVDLYYTTLVNNKPLFENIDSQYVKSNNSIEYKTDWISFKSQINSLLNAQAWDIFELKKTQDFERAIKWSELSNSIEKENPYSLDTLGQLYFAVGRKTEAIAIQTKAVEIAKQAGMNAEEFEFALNNMKK